MGSGFGRSFRVDANDRETPAKRGPWLSAAPNRRPK